MVSITKCPTAYVARTLQGRPVSEADVAALRAHALVRDRKSIAAAERAAIRMARIHEFSPRARKGGGNGEM